MSEGVSWLRGRSFSRGAGFVRRDGWWVMLSRWPSPVMALVVVVVLVSCAGRGGVSVSVSPTAATLEPGGSVSFTAIVTGAGSGDVMWSSSGGQLAPSGVSAVFTAPAEVGAYTVTARSVADQGRWATATVTVAQREDPSAGGQLVGDQGALIGVQGGYVVSIPPGAIVDGELLVTVSLVDASSVDVNDDVELVGSVLRVRASEAFELDPSVVGPILVSLPVGDLAAPLDGFWVGVLAPQGSWVGVPGTFWHAMPGEPSDGGDKVSLRLYGLPAEDISFAWVQVDEADVSGADGVLGDVEAPRLQPGVGTSDVGLVWLNQVHVVVPPGYRGAFGTSDQRTAVTGHVRDYALEAIAGFSAMGFRPPRWTVSRLVPLAYAMHVYHPSQAPCLTKEDQPRGGAYHPLLHTLFVCWFVGDGFGQPDGPNTTRFTTRHEIFHAVQNAYTRLVFMSSHPSLAFIEGTAMLAERSLDGEARRSPDEPFETSAEHQWASLVANGHEYRAQDMFAFLLRTSGAGFAAVAELMPSRDLSWSTLDQVLRTSSTFGSVGSLGEFYWAYVRNQRFERFRTLGDLGAWQVFVGADPANGFDAVERCSHSVTSGTAVVREIVWSDALDAFVFEYEGAASLGDALPGLSSSMWMLELPAHALAHAPQGVEARIRVVPEAGTASAPASMSVKFYRDGHDCSSDELETALLGDLIGMLGEGPVYVLVANVDPTLEGAYALTLETIGAPPSVSVSVEPSSVVVPVHGTQSFTATVTGAGDTSVAWSTTCGSISGSGNTILYTAPGSVGTCAVTATSNHDSGTSARAVVTVEGIGNPPSLGNVRSVASGGSHSLALLQDGSVWAWGSNGAGQLGDGTNTQRETPVQVASLTNVHRVAAGYGHSLAVGEDGTVWAWGRNHRGQLGDGSTTNRNTPVQVMGLANVRDAAAGGAHSLAVAEDGSVWAWGFNHFGQLGDGSTLNRWTPVRVVGITRAHMVAAGEDFSLAVHDDGLIWAWGRNSTGQLGNGTISHAYAPLQVVGLTNVGSAAAGAHHTVAVRDDGSVWSWGYNYYGQVGDGGSGQRNSPVEVAGLTDVRRVAAGGVHSLAVRADGSVWSWGYNFFGQLGTGNTATQRRPVGVMGLDDARGVAAGYYHSLAVGDESGAWAWGSNANGQVGDGSTTDRPTAVEVALPGAARDPAGE